MELVTGRKGSAHITSQQDRMKHQGTWGSGAYILQTGQMLEPQVQSSNEIRIQDGALMVQGALSCVKVNTYDPVTIQNGTQGMKRIDLICWQYSYDAEQDVESAEWVVIQGTPAESDPQQPSYTDGDIQLGDSLVQVPAFAVELDGINVTGVTTLLQTAPTLKELNSNLNTITDVAYKKMNVGKEGYSYTDNCISLSGINLNTISESGFYYCDNCPGRPESKNGYMIAISRSGGIRGMQIYFPNDGAMWKRMNNDNQWLSWVKLLDG